VKRIPLVRPVIDRTVVLIRKKNASLSPAAQNFYDMLARQLQTATKPVRKGKPRDPR